MPRGRKSSSSDGCHHKPHPKPPKPDPKPPKPDPKPVCPSASHIAIGVLAFVLVRKSLQCAKKKHEDDKYDHGCCSPAPAPTPRPGCGCA